MKRKTTLFILFILSCLDLIAQEGGPLKNWRFGVIGGVQPYGKVFDSADWQSTSGYIAGFSAQYHFKAKWKGFSVLAQPHWNELRQNFESGPDSWGSVEGKWKTTSFNLPLLIRHSVGNGTIRPFVELGPSFRFRTSLSYKGSGALCGVVGCSPFDYTRNLQSTTSQDRVGLMAGIGAELNLRRVAIPVILRIDQSSGTFEVESRLVGTPVYIDGKARTFQIVTGISF